MTSHGATEGQPSGIPFGATAARILVVDPIAPQAMAQLRATYDVTAVMQPDPEQLGRLLQEADAIVLRSGVELRAPLIESASRLRVVARAGNGTDNIDLDAANRQGVQVFNIPSVSGQAVAEFSLGLLLSVARNIARADREIRQGHWRKAELTGTGLAGKTLGAIGLGDIGGRVARICLALGMNVIGCVRNPTAERRDRLRREGIELVSRTNVLRAADFLILCCPLNESTKGIIGDKELRMMKNSAYLINIARGEIVDQNSLYEALAGGRLAGAALDVHSAVQKATRLAELDNVVLTPHIGAMSHEAQHRIGEILMVGLGLALSGRNAPTRIY